MQEIFELILKTYGIAGILILAPFGAAIYLWRDNQSLNKDLIASAKESTTAAKESSAKLAETQAAFVTKLAEAHTEFSKKLSEANDKVVAAQVQRVQDAQALTGKLMEIVSEQSSLNKETNNALERLHDVVRAAKG